MTVRARERYIQRERRLAETLERYAGQWVAIRDHEVIAHATTAETLHEHLKDDVAPYRTLRVTRGAGATLL